MKKLFLALALCLVFVLAACGGGDSKDGKSSASGESIFDDKCSSCHDDAASVAIGDAAAIKEVIKSGTGSMKANIVTGDDADKVAEYVAGQK